MNSVTNSFFKVLLSTYYMQSTVGNYIINYQLFLFLLPFKFNGMEGIQMHTPESHSHEPLG